MTANRCKPLDWPEFVDGLIEFARDETDSEFRNIFLQAIEKPQNWQAPVKAALCRAIDGRAA